jgi:hypothetical protein
MYVCTRCRPSFRSGRSNKFPTLVKQKPIFNDQDEHPYRTFFRRTTSQIRRRSSLFPSRICYTKKFLSKFWPHSQGLNFQVVLH